MTADIIKWNNTPNKSIYQSYIEIGKKIWKQVHDNIYINQGLIDLVPTKDFNKKDIESQIKKVASVNNIDLPLKVINLIKNQFQKEWQAQDKDFEKKRDGEVKNKQKS